MKTLLLIDANSLIHRAFHALPPLTGPEGQATQALYGLASVLLKIWRDDKPDYVAALFDRPEPTFRKEKFEAYKAHRPKAPNELVSQIIEAHTLFEKFGIKTLEKPGFEADDLIATLATKFSDKEKDLQVVILTGDLDTLQIVRGDKLVVRTFKKGISETMTYNEEAVRERYGLEPKQLTDYKALVGDQSDNVPGVSGVGEKTATSLLQKYGTLEGIYKNLDAEPKLGKKLVGTEKEAEFSKSLVALEKNAPVGMEEVDDLKVVENGKDLEKYFQSLGFQSLIKRLEGKSVRSSGGEDQKEKVNISVRPTRAKVSSSSAKQASIFGDLPRVELGGDENKVFVYEGSGKKDLESKKLKAGFELKRLLKEAWEEEGDILPPYFDLGVAFWMLDPDFKDYSPEAAAKHFLKKDWRGSEGDYEAAYGFCEKKIKEYEIGPVFRNIEMPLLRVLAEMEKAGIFVNTEKLKALEGKIEKDINELTKKIYKVAGEEFNINSSQQLGKIIFEKLGVDSRLAKRTGGGKISTREESLLIFKGQHEIIDLILEYRENFKIQTTYVKPLYDLIAKDGRVHTDFVQTGAATGRLSSRNPNLQNVPQESKWSKEFRSVFEAQKGFSFVSFDYSQIELRVFAAVAGDDKMIEAFKNGIDIHSLTAAKILGKPLQEVTKDDRRVAKTLNFGLLYGMGVSSFAKSSGLKRDQAKQFVEAYFREFSEIRDWQEKTKEEARKYGFVRTLSGRRRYLPGIKSFAPQVVAEAERAAINHPLQGLAADIIKMAMIKAQEILDKKGLGEKKARMLLSIHDELLFEVSDDIIKEVNGAVREAMERVFDLGVPLKVEVSSGKDWGNLNRL